MSGIQSICLSAVIGSAMMAAVLGDAPAVPPGLDLSLPPVGDIPLPEIPGLPPVGAPPPEDTPDVPDEPDMPPTEAPDDEQDIAQAPDGPAPPETDETALEDMGFVVYKNQDYAPNQEPAPEVSIIDIGTGTTVDSAVACAMQCTENPDCSALSYYGDLPSADWPGSKNCYIKTLASCEIPDDATEHDDGRYFLIYGATCGAAAAAAPAPATTITAPVPSGTLDPPTLTPAPITTTRALTPSAAPGPVSSAPAPGPSSLTPPLNAGTAPISSPPLTPQVSDTSAASYMASAAWFSALAAIAAYMAM